MALIIVESPTKARTFNRILKGRDYYVFATMGHFRDLPGKSMAINFKEKFKPEYEIIEAKEKMVATLLDLAKKNKEIILATDLDREGEAISYHAAYVLGFIRENWPDFKIEETGNLKRIVFHEITERALKEALASPGSLRVDLVKAQQARRILDRVVGYELSPLLWKKMGKHWLSAGRVQTVALRLVVEREKEINRFEIDPYFQIYAEFLNSEKFKAKLTAKNDVVYEVKNKIKLFDGEYTYTKTTIDKELSVIIRNELNQDNFKVTDVREETVKRYPPPPFTTSLLQQEGFRRFGFSSKMTMKLAQDLYERGMITYHRTDSFSLASFFVFKAKDYIAEKYGRQYTLDKPRGFKTKSKSAQEAHEAIRPTSLKKEPEDLKIDKKLTSAHKKLYELIFDRAVATQMKEAQIKQIKIAIESVKGYRFEAEEQQVVFDGFLRVLNPEFADRNQHLISIKINDSLKLDSLEPQELSTTPPPRYNEASLIKTLEEKGIGRPSTYAPIISLIQDKNYIEKAERYFQPTKLGEIISDYLSKAFPQVFDLGFTAAMEEGLDRIANGEEDFIRLLENFYGDFKKELDVKRKDKTLIDVEERTGEKCGKCGGDMVVRFSKFGKFLGCSNYPKCRNIKSFLQTVKDRKCPECGGDIVIRFTRKRKRFYGCINYPKCKYSSWKLGIKSAGIAATATIPPATSASTSK